MLTRQELVHQIRESVKDGEIEKAFDLFNKGMSALDSTTMNEVTLLEGQYNTLRKSFFQGKVEREQFNVDLTRINYAILDLIGKFEQRTNSPIKKIEHGKLLHTIPNKMTVGAETKFIIRLAYDEDTLKLNLPKSTKGITQTIRISDVMNVEVCDLADTSHAAFQIRALNKAEQFVEAEDFTQWIFIVKPLRSGKIPLLVRISVIEIINNKERSREIVFEKEISVIAEKAANRNDLVKIGESERGYVAAASLPLVTWHDSNIQFKFPNGYSTFTKPEYNGLTNSSSIIGVTGALTKLFTFSNVIISSAIGLTLLGVYLFFNPIGVSNTGLPKPSEHTLSTDLTKQSDQMPINSIDTSTYQSPQPSTNSVNKYTNAAEPTDYDNLNKKITEQKEEAAEPTDYDNLSKKTTEQKKEAAKTANNDNLSKKTTEQKEEVDQEKFILPEISRLDPLKFKIQGDYKITFTPLEVSPYTINSKYLFTTVNINVELNNENKMKLDTLNELIIQLYKDIDRDSFIKYVIDEFNFGRFADIKDSASDETLIKEELFVPALKYTLNEYYNDGKYRPNYLNRVMDDSVSYSNLWSILDSYIPFLKKMYFTIQKNKEQDVIKNKLVISK